MSLRDGLTLAEATVRQQHLDQAHQTTSLAEDERIVRRAIAQYEAGDDTPVARVISKWIASRTAQSF
ncbi:MAG: hypothetical protein WC693_05880 [Patescibacteria group bacterium]|jgi:hypothetical protein